MAIPSPLNQLPPDDLPPAQPGGEDFLLRRQLDLSLTGRFQAYCDPPTQAILSRCDWSIKTIAQVATLVIVCPNRATNWQVLNQVIPLGSELAKLSQAAKLRIYATLRPLQPEKSCAIGASQKIKRCPVFAGGGVSS
ncbi:MAG: hypothetical protein ACO3NK_11725 [Prochlorotrichaceae cyanobacterium]